MIVGEKNADFLHADASSCASTEDFGGNGSSICSMVPAPERESMRNFPSNRLTRSEITHEPKAANAVRIETDAIILNGEHDAGCLLCNADVDPFGARVLGSVSQRFLYDAVDASLVFVRKVFAHSFVGNHGGYTSAARGFARRRGWNEAEVVKHGGAQQKRHIANGIERRLSELAKALGDSGGPEAAGVVSCMERPSISALGSSATGRFRREVRGDGATFGFLGVDQAGGEFLELILDSNALSVAMLGNSFEVECVEAG